MTWIDGGYTPGEQTEIEGHLYTLRTSLGSLGWVAEEMQSGKHTILLFTDIIPTPTHEERHADG